MGSMATYDAGDDIDLDSPQPLKKVPQTKLSTKIMDENFDESESENGSDEEEENDIKYFEVSDEELFQVVPNIDELDVKDSVGATFTGCVLKTGKLFGLA